MSVIFPQDGKFLSDFPHRIFRASSCSELAWAREQGSKVEKTSSGARRPACSQRVHLGAQASFHRPSLPAEAELVGAVTKATSSYYYPLTPTPQKRVQDEQGNKISKAFACFSVFACITICYTC